MAPDDILGTVRAGHGLLAIRAHSANPEWADELSWYIIDIGADEVPEEIEDLIADWPIVYQP